MKERWNIPVGMSSKEKERESRETYQVEMQMQMESRTERAKLPKSWKLRIKRENLSFGSVD